MKFKSVKLFSFLLLLIQSLNAECPKYLDWINSPTFKIDKEHCDYFDVEKFMSEEFGWCSQASMNSMWYIMAECDALNQKNNIQSETVVYDYVSDYDWANVSIEDLPWQIDTWRVGGSQYISYVDYLDEIEFSGSLLDMHIFWLDQPLCSDYPDCYEYSNFTTFTDQIDLSECSAEQHRHNDQIQILSGAVTLSDSGELRCQECTNQKDVFGNILVDCFYYMIYTDEIIYGDANFDGYMDVFMAFNNVGKGSLQIGYTWVYLTKTDPNQKTFTMIKPLKHQTDSKRNDLIVMIDDIMSFPNFPSFKIDKIKNDFNSDRKINIRDLLIMIKVSDETK